jgi:hypothetical protein
MGWDNGRNEKSDTGLLKKETLIFSPTYQELFD